MTQPAFQAGDTVRLTAKAKRLAVLSAPFQLDGRYMVKLSVEEDGFAFETTLPTVFLEKV